MPLSLVATLGYKVGALPTDAPITGAIAPTVLVGGIPIAIVPLPIAPTGEMHGTPHDPPVAAHPFTGAPRVFAEGLPVHRVGDLRFTTCSHPTVAPLPPEPPPTHNVFCGD